MSSAGSGSRGALGLALATVILAAVPAHPRDIDRKFRCEADALTDDARIKVARVKASVPEVAVVNSMIIATGPAQVRNTKKTTRISWDTTWGRCPILPHQCAPRGRLRAGEPVAVWEHMSKHRCMTSLYTEGWVEAAHLEPVPAPAPADWTGAYGMGGFDDIAIVAGDDGMLAVSGARIVGAGEGPGFTAYDLNEIPLTWVKPKNGVIVLRYRTKISAMSKGEKVEYRGGEPAPAGCTLKARLNPPLLVIKDAPGCGGERASGFEGIWFPRRQGNPEPRDDHARTIALGR